MPDNDFCLGCGQGQLYDGQFFDLDIETAGVEWPPITLCPDCLTDWAEDLGYGHIADEVTA